MQAFSRKGTREIKDVEQKHKLYPYKQTFPNLKEYATFYWNGNLISKGFGKLRNGRVSQKQIYQINNLGEIKNVT